MTDEIVASLIHELERRSQESALNARTDSIEIGTPSKGGVLKVYFDAGESQEVIHARIDRAADALRYANAEREKVVGVPQ